MVDIINDKKAVQPKKKVNMMQTLQIVPLAILNVMKIVFWAINQIMLVFIKFLAIMSRLIRHIMRFIPKIISGFIPKKTSSGLRTQLTYAGVEMTPPEVISITLVYSIVISVTSYVLAIVFGATIQVSLIVVFISFIAIWSLPFILLNMLSNNRAKSVEDTLPDILTMVAQNISAGMTSYNALWNSARPEFGPLAVEIQDVAKATLTGIPLTDALMRMTNHVRSVKLERVVRLMIQGMKSGGDLPIVLTAIANDMRQEDNLRKQMAAETSAQSIFIFFAIAFGAPLLFGVSTQFITIFSKMMSKLNIEELSKDAPQAMISLSPLSVTPDEFQLYAVAMLTVCAIFGSLLMGILKDGNASSGIPTIPVLAIMAVVIFFAIKTLLGTLFGGMVTF